MKSFDRYSLRGVVLMFAGVAGIIAEYLFMKPAELFLVIMYGMVILIGLILIGWVRE
jgi:hypothetical protein